MSLDFSLYEVKPCEVFSRNITHNLGKMAREAGVYQALWRPEEIGALKAKDVVPVLTAGLAELKAKPDHYKQFDAENGWGRYSNFVDFVQGVLSACIEMPEADIKVCR